MLTLTVIELQSSQFAVKPPPRPMFGPTETANGYVMITVASEKTFQGLMGVIGRPEWISDPRFATYAARRENWADMMDGVEAWSRQLSTDECLVGLSAAGVPASAYRTITEALADPQLAHRQALSAVQDEGGSFRVLNLPFRMTGADTTPGERMAALGEHTRELRNEVGLADDAPIPSGKTSVQG
jgi:crotonobetainyl-CoA:carnitine CoA-transferase CaiB-like acyl-CoA transferase